MGWDGREGGDQAGQQGRYGGGGVGRDNLKGHETNALHPSPPKDEKRTAFE